MPGAPDVEDPDAALRRLESMGTSKDAAQAADSTPVPPVPAVDQFSAPPTRRQRPTGSSRRTPPRPAGGPGSTRMVARIAAPVVFLVAVIALLGIVVNSGVLGGADEPLVTPTVKATKTKSGTTTVTTKKYVIKSGDSLSSIAARFHISTSELQKLNPGMSGSSTLIVGQRIVVPAQ